MTNHETLGKPEEERTASSSTQSASGLGGGTPEGTPSEGRGEPRTGHDEAPGPDSARRERREERNQELERRAPSDEPDNSADDGAVRTDF